MATVNDNDGQHHGINGADLDPVESDNESEGDSERDDGPASDAGSGAETEAAQAREARFKFQVVESKMAADEVAEQLRATEPNLLGRAAALRNAKLFEFKTEEKKSALGFPMAVVINSDHNRRIFFDTMFGTGSTRPHIDLFRGRFVDHVGRLVDDRYSMLPMIEAMEAAGLEKQSVGPVRQAFKEYVMLRQKNDLTESFGARIPEWDGVSRLEERLIELYECFDTQTTRLVGKYFWLSIYNRIMNPGCQAPIVLSLFGAQFAGKSRLSHSLCQIIMNDKEAQAVLLDLGSNTNDFLRRMTGLSVVANIGEMTGFNKADLNKIKDFIVKTSDVMDYKYEGQFKQLRQWISILDGNEYEGLQRDHTGNRRFYPIFLGQMPDEEGKPKWRDDFKADWTDFEAIFWQIIGECRAWMTEHGLSGWNELINEATAAVKEFNDEEMKNDRGTIRDDKLDAFLRPALRICEVHLLKNPKNRGVAITSAEISNRVAQVSRNRCDLNMRHLANKMTAMGATPLKNPKFNAYYLFRDHHDVPKFRAWLDGDYEAMEGEGEKDQKWVSPIADKDEGF